MLELCRADETGASGSDLMNLSYGGDTLNTAVYLARLGIVVNYVTALGDDSMSGWMLREWSGEGVGCALVRRMAGAVPGLYLIETDTHGERSFLYWRDSSPARQLFDNVEDTARLFDALQDHEWIYLSGITLAILGEAGRELLMEKLKQYRLAGGRVAFDSNYRPALWENVATTQSLYQRLYSMTDLALATDADEAQLFGDDSAEGTMARLRQMGIREIVLKTGARGCLVTMDGKTQAAPCQAVQVVDATAAGDAFNAGYLAARLEGEPPPDAARRGHQLAGVVVSHRGAVIPREYMPIS
jgi:2-dehydro-3-deoxygluconokinase